MRRFAWKSVLRLPLVASLLAAPALAAPPATSPPATPPPVLVNVELVVSDLHNQIASHSRRIDQLLEERRVLIAQRAALSAQVEAARKSGDKALASLMERQAQLTRAVEDRDRQLLEQVLRQDKLLSVAGAQRTKLEKFENKRRLLRFVTGASVGLQRFPDFQLGETGGGAPPEQAPPDILRKMELDVFGGVAILPVDLDKRDGHQSFSLGFLLGLGGNGFPANLYTGLTFKLWFLYLNAGLNFRKQDTGLQGLLARPIWEGTWTPTLFAGLSLDGEALLALQELLPSKPAPEGLQVEPR